MDITLEKFGPQDFPEYFSLVGNAEVMAMITERAIPAEEAQRDYDRILVSNALRSGLGHFRVLDERGSFLGLGKLEVETVDADRAELGYMLLPESWGKGIASRIAARLVAKAEQQPALRSLFAIIDPSNVPSRKILTHHGFVSKEFRDFGGLPGEVLERTW